MAHNPLSSYYLPGWGQLSGLSSMDMGSMTGAPGDTFAAVAPLINSMMDMYSPEAARRASSLMASDISKGYGQRVQAMKAGMAGRGGTRAQFQAGMMPSMLALPGLHAESRAKTMEAYKGTRAKVISEHALPAAASVGARKEAYSVRQETRKEAKEDYKWQLDLQEQLAAKHRKRKMLQGIAMMAGGPLLSMLGGAIGGGLGFLGGLSSGGNALGLGSLGRFFGGTPGTENPTTGMMEGGSPGLLPGLGNMLETGRWGGVPDMPQTPWAEGTTPSPEQMQAYNQQLMMWIMAQRMQPNMWDQFNKGYGF